MSIKKTIDYKSQLNRAQYQVVTAGNGPSLVLAGAGSGKTRTLVYRVAYLLEQGVSPESILLLTFTNKAAKEMLQRLEQLDISKAKVSKIWGGTFHSVANRLLRIMGNAIGLKPNFTILDRQDSKDMIKRIVKAEGKGYGVKRLPQPGIFLEVISYAVNAQISMADALETKYPEGTKDQTLFENVAVQYAKKKQLSNALDFDDMLLYWWRLLQKPTLRKKINGYWQYILVDEYQDTNVVQDSIVTLLAEDHQNILVVGDDAQSIYSFRAADIRNILEFPKRFPKTKIHKLEKNYRSTPEILEVANQVIKKNVEQYRKALYTEEKNFIKPEVWALKDAAAEATSIADRIIALEDEGVELWQMAVLFRAGHDSQALELELNRRNIPYELRGGLRFFERAHIKDCLSFCKLFVNHQDEAAWYRILLLQEGVGDVVAQKIMYQAMELNDWQQILAMDPRISNAATRGFSDLIRLLTAVYTEKSHGPAAMIRTIKKYYGDYLKYKYTDFKDRLDDLDQLALFAESYEKLDDFVTDTSLQEAYALRGASDLPKERGVILSTVHQAKGLEWHTVFIMRLTSHSFPHSRAMREEGGLEEERRLFYVAITRAQKRLYLSYPISASQYSLSISQPSQFLLEINPKLLSGDVYDEDSDSVIYVDEDSPSTFLPPINRL